MADAERSGETEQAESSADRPSPDLQLKELIGGGTFSWVYSALYRGQMVAVKRIRPGCSVQRILNEAQLLLKLRGEHNVVALLDTIRNEDRVDLVLPYFHHVPFRELLPTVTEDQIRRYMRALLVALEHVHRANFVHRDIKPANFLVHPGFDSFLLVDFGLAEPAAKLPPLRSVASGKPVPRPASRMVGDPRGPMQASRAGTRGFRAPEVLLRATAQGTPLDTWAAGVVLLSLLTGRYPFFHARDDIDALTELAALLGPRALQQAGAACDRLVFLPPALPPVTERSRPERLRAVCESVRVPGHVRCSEAAYDVAAALLDPVPQTRASAHTALRMPWLAADSEPAGAVHVGAPTAATAGPIPTMPAAAAAAAAPSGATGDRKRRADDAFGTG